MPIQYVIKPSSSHQKRQICSLDRDTLDDLDDPNGGSAALLTDQSITKDTSSEPGKTCFSCTATIIQYFI